MNKKRLRILSKQEEKEGPVVYWMNRDCRAEDNWAMLYALEKANQKKAPLLVVYNLEIGFLGGGYRQHHFKVQGLREMAESLAAKKIPFFLVKGSIADLQTWLRLVKPGLLVTDFSPLNIQKTWLEKITTEADCSVHQVDTHNIIPVWEISDKQEYAARTIRPKIYKKIKEFLDPFPRLSTPKTKYAKSVPSIAWGEVLDNFPNKSILPASWILPGAKAGKQKLELFLEKRLDRYAVDRNNALKKGQSDLSPYLHYGHIAPQRVALEVLEKTNQSVEQIMQKDKNGAATENSSAAFLEELIVRRELADNFCHYNNNYDSVLGFPDWAQKTLQKHLSDKRAYHYSLIEFEQAKTHDELWNAAQLELSETGKMHGYMRMYWAKKILEWTKSPEEAMKIAIYLNDAYSFDGRDPNGYAGIAWSIGGVHDRPWFERPIFGTIRYLAESGVKKRFNIKEYIEQQKAGKLDL